MKTFAFISLGFFLACAVGAVAGFTSKMNNPVDRTPTDLIIATKDTPEGESVAQTRTFTLPANMVSESMIRASDWPKVSKRKTNWPVLEGDVLTWQHFAPTERYEATKQCVLELHSGLEAAVTECIATELQAMQPVELKVEDPPQPRKAATVRVMIAAGDLKQGITIGPTSLKSVELPIAFFTESLIQASDGDSVIGAVTATELQAGDVVWWQHLQREGVLGTNACVAKLEAATKRVREEYSQKNAAAFQGVTP